MPREVERQTDQYSQAPHAQLLEEHPDSAYGGEQRPWDDDLNFEDMSRGHYNRLRNKFDPDVNDDARQYRDEARGEQLDKDEASGYNWGPPPLGHHVQDPGFGEHEVDSYPHA